MPQPRYRSCYQVLRVSPYCDFADLRLAYRRRVNESHPDRFYAVDPERARHQEADLKRVVIAYRLLLTYFRYHGELPDGDLPIAPLRRVRPTPQSGKDDVDTTPPAPLWREIRGPWRRTAIWLLVAVLSVELVATAWYRNQERRSQTETMTASDSANTTSGNSRRPSP